MLRELKKVRQIEGDRHRRWFADEELDLILWYGPEKKLDGFQICYDKLAGTRMITWKNIETRDGSLKSILMTDSPEERDRIRTMIADRSDNLDGPLKQFILDRLESNGG